MQERIEELLQAIDDKDWDKLSAIFHEDIIYERPGYQPLVGIGQVLQFYEKERLIFSGQPDVKTHFVGGGVGMS